MSISGSDGEIINIWQKDNQLFVSNASPISFNQNINIINNSNPIDLNNPLRINIISDIIITDADTYFILDDISSYGNITIDGGNHTVYINGVNNFLGLFRNGTGNINSAQQIIDGKLNIIIQNVEIDGTNNSQLYTNTSVPNYTAAGWIGQSYFQYGNFNNCSSNGDISVNCCGGIIGSTCGSFGGIINLNNCYSTGNIGVNNNNLLYWYGSGGIIGYSVAHTNGTINVYNCYSTGSISENNTNGGSGGIIGPYAGYYCDTTTQITVKFCYSTGSIGKNNSEDALGSGGIFGYSAGNFGSGIIIVDSCYSTGSIGENNTFTAQSKYSGGIFGPFVGNSTINIKKCYSLGGSDNNGIIGSDPLNYTITKSFSKNSDGKTFTYY
jgi:hypothetical protein